MLSGIDRVDYKLIDYIKMAESTLQNKKQNSGGETCGKPEEANPGLFGWDRLFLGNPRFHQRNLLTSGLLNQLIFLILYSIRISTSS